MIDTLLPYINDKYEKAHRGLFLIYIYQEGGLKIQIHRQPAFLLVRVYRYSPFAYDSIAICSDGYSSLASAMASSNFL